MTEGAACGASVYVCTAACRFSILARWASGCASPIAQLVERAAVNLKVAGSNPDGRAAFTHTTHAQPSPVSNTHTRPVLLADGFHELLPHFILSAV